MYYSESEARDLVIKAGLELIKHNLIARTWGNISARFSKDEFVITPSGRSYEDLKPEDLVIVKIADSSYDGDIKPSSEKGLHAKAYQYRENISFIVHTHQPYATALSVERVDYSFAPCAKYGLPGTKKLALNTSNVILANPNSKVFLMERHGVISLGETYEDAFTGAYDLEVKAKEEYDNNHTERDEKDHMKPYLDDFAQMFGFSSKAVEEDETAKRLIIEKNTLASNYRKKAKVMNVFDVLLQHTVYKLKYSKLKDKQ